MKWKPYILILLCVILSGCAVKQVTAPSYSLIADASVQIIVTRNDGLMINGSGVYVSEDGYIATARHIVQDANSVVVINRGQYAEGVSWSYLQDQDIGLLKVNTHRINYVEISSKPDLSKGTPVFCVSNDSSLKPDRLVTGNVITPDTHTTNFGDVIFMSLKPKRGMSGSGVFNYQGELIGILVAGDPNFSLATHSSDLLRLMEIIYARN